MFFKNVNKQLKIFKCKQTAEVYFKNVNKQLKYNLKMIFVQDQKGNFASVCLCGICMSENSSWM